MPGPNPKPQERRQRTNQRDVGLVALPGGQIDTPDPEPKWLKATKDAWGEFWGSKPAGLVMVDSDMPALRRLFGYYDEQVRDAKAYREQPYVSGSKGQPVANPAGDRVLKLEPLIRALEDRFGLTPMARLKLGVTFADAAASLDELNRSYVDDDSDEEPDPRLQAIDAESEPA